MTANSEFCLFEAALICYWGYSPWVYYLKIQMHFLGFFCLQILTMSAICSSTLFCLFCCVTKEFKFVFSLVNVF